VVVDRGEPHAHELALAAERAPQREPEPRARASVNRADRRVGDQAAPVEVGDRDLVSWPRAG